MKREIICSDCNIETRGIKPKDLLINNEDVENAGGLVLLPVPLPEEIKKVYGRALTQLHCDLCNGIIEKGEYCVARSIIGYKQNYIPWEFQFIGD